MKYNGFEYNFTARVGKINIFGGGMSERILTNTCDDEWNPNLLLYCDQSRPACRSARSSGGRVDSAGSNGVNVGLAFQSLPGYVYGTTSQYAPHGCVGSVGHHDQRCAGWCRFGVADHPHDHLHGVQPCVASGKCTAGQVVNPAQTQATLNIPLVALMTGIRRPHQPAGRQRHEERQDRPLQHPAEVRRLQPAEPRTGHQRPGLNYGTAAYMVPSVILNGRTMQVGANVRFNRRPRPSALFRPDGRVGQVERVRKTETGRLLFEEPLSSVRFRLKADDGSAGRRVGGSAGRLAVEGGPSIRSRLLGWPVRYSSDSSERGTPSDGFCVAGRGDAADTAGSPRTKTSRAQGMTSRSGFRPTAPSPQPTTWPRAARPCAIGLTDTRALPIDLPSRRDAACVAARRRTYLPAHPLTRLPAYPADLPTHPFTRRPAHLPSPSCYSVITVDGAFRVAAPT